jgi:glutaredoxin-like protein NrdH
MQITVYTTKNCAQCMMTKKQFDKLGIRYDEIALEQHPELVERFKEIGLLSAPIVVTDVKRWSGFRLDKIRSLANHLFSEKQND